MGPFEAGRRAILAIADIYDVLAKFFRHKGGLRAIFTIMTHEYRTEANRVDKWVARWREEYGDRVPDVDVRQIAALVDQIESFGRELKKAEVIDPEDAIGLAQALERELAAAHEVRGTSAVGGFFNELTSISREHSLLLDEALDKSRRTGTATSHAAIKIPRNNRADAG